MPEQFPPTTREVDSNIQAFARAPWGEVHDRDETAEFLAHFHAAPNGFVLTFPQEAGGSPYLYIHGMHYGADKQLLIDQEFAGEETYYTAADPDVIADALEGRTNVTYIANIHADKSFVIDDAAKPRLQVLPEVVDELFARYQSDALVLYTHRHTPVFGAVGDLDPNKYTVDSVAYQVEKKPPHLNDQHHIDYLQLLIIRPLTTAG